MKSGIAGLVAAIIKSELRAASERAYTAFLVDSDSRPRRASGLMVEFEHTWFRSREASPMLKIFGTAGAKVGVYRFIL